MDISVKTITLLSVGTVLIAVLSACANTRQAPMSNSPMTGPVNTGTYPHFTPDPKGETTQFTPEEKDSLRSRMATAKRGQAGPSADPNLAANQAAMKQQLQKDQQDTFNAIEGK
jgi:hypothetical protein